MTEKMYKAMSPYAPIIHRHKVATWYIRALRKARWMRNAYQRPKNLTITTVSTYPKKSLFEQSLTYLGITDYIVLNEPFRGPYRNTLKVQWILNYLNSRECKTKYLLYCDARDAILKDDPQLVLSLFKNTGKKLIFNSTSTKRALNCMRDKWRWMREIAPLKGRYLNAGAFIGEVSFIKKVLKKTMEYIDPDELEIRSSIADCDQLPEFPKGTSDQVILRYIFDQFYPDMDIDYGNRIFYRN